MSTKPLIVILCLNHSAWFDVHNADLVSELSQKDVVHKLAKTPSQAHRYLTSTTRPLAVILTDGAVTEAEHHALHMKLVEYAMSGGTVIYARPFNAEYVWPDPDLMFQDLWGLPWRIASSYYTGGSHAVNPLFKAFNTEGLVKQYSFHDAYPVDTVALEDAVYVTPTIADELERAPASPTKTYETPVAFAKVGRGRVGYIGESDHYLEHHPRTDIILAMCFWPGSAAPIAPGKVPVSSPVVAVRPCGPRTRDAEVTVRTEARKKVREDKRKRADKIKEEGNDLSKEERFEEAAEKYREAALLGGPQPVYLANLAACLLKLELCEFADSAATRALTYDPKHVKALYRRAMARKELGRHSAALADLGWLLTVDESNASALKEKLAMPERLEILGSLDWPEDTSLGSLRDHMAMDIENELDSEDFAHSGNGIACRDYNVSETRCRSGKTCHFSHAPDSKSVRDRLGRNVCVYWLIGHCRFAEAGECVYAHDATCLPARRWWTDTARLERIRTEFENAIKEEPLDLGNGPVEESILAEAFALLPWRKDMWVFGAYEDESGLAPSVEDGDYDYGYSYDSSEEDGHEEDRANESSGSDSDGAESLGYEYECDREDEEERGELNEYGVTDADVEEMWEYGIKPWEDGAYEEMLRIRRILNSI